MSVALGPLVTCCLERSHLSVLGPMDSYSVGISCLIIACRKAANRTYSICNKPTLQHEQFRPCVRVLFFPPRACARSGTHRPVKGRLDRVTNCSESLPPADFWTLCTQRGTRRAAQHTRSGGTARPHPHCGNLTSLLFLGNNEQRCRGQEIPSTVHHFEFFWLRAFRPLLHHLALLHGFTCLSAL